MADGYDACTVESSALPGVSRLSYELGRLAVLQYWVACMHTSWMVDFLNFIRSGVILDDSHLSIDRSRPQVVQGRAFIADTFLVFFRCW